MYLSSPFLVGGWPSRQDVDKILKVSIWSTDDFSAPTAIEIKYKTVSDPDTPISKSHGVKNAAAEAYAVGEFTATPVLFYFIDSYRCS